MVASVEYDSVRVRSTVSDDDGESSAKVAVGESVVVIVTGILTVHDFQTVMVPLYVVDCDATSWESEGVGESMSSQRAAPCRECELDTVTWAFVTVKFTDLLRGDREYVEISRDKVHTAVLVARRVADDVK